MDDVEEEGCKQLVGDPLIPGASANGPAPVGPMLFRSAPRTFGVRDVIGPITQLLEILDRHGLRAHSKSRLARFREIAQRISARGKVATATAEEIVELGVAARNADQLRDIALLLDVPTLSPPLRTEVERFLGGTCRDPQASGRTTELDAQAQLFQAVTMMKAGAVVEVAEPDIVAVFEGWRFGVAVKRVKALGKLGRHISKGCQQLRANGLEGVVLVDLSALLLPEGMVLRVETPDHMGDRTAAALRNFMRANEPRLGQYFDIEVCLGWLAYAQLGFGLPAPPFFGHWNHWEMGWTRQGDPRNAVLGRLHAGYSRRGNRSPAT